MVGLGGGRGDGDRSGQLDELFAATGLSPLDDDVLDDDLLDDESPDDDVLDDDVDESPLLDSELVDEVSADEVEVSLLGVLALDDGLVLASLR